MTPEILYPPEGGPTYVVSLWGHNLISFSLIYSPKKPFLGLNLLAVSAHLWPHKFFNVTDGWWVMGDGLVRTYFLSAYFSKTTRYISLIVFMPPRRGFKTSFVKKSKFLKNLFFVKKFRTKRVFFCLSILKRIPIFLD